MVSRRGSDDRPATTTRENEAWTIRSSRSLTRIKVMVRGTRRAGSWARAVSRSEMPPSLPLVDAPDALRSGGRVSSSCVRMAHGYVCIMAIASVRLRASTRNVHSTRALPLELRHPPFSSSLALFSLLGRITRARLILIVLLVEVRDASGRGAGRAGRFSRENAQLHFLLEHGGHSAHSSASANFSIEDCKQYRSYRFRRARGRFAGCPRHPPLTSLPSDS